jgi:hypothetical protein
MNILIFLISVAISLTVFYYVKSYLIKVSVPLTLLGLSFAWGLLLWPIRLWLSPQIEDVESILRFSLPVAETLLKVIPA